MKFRRSMKSEKDTRPHHINLQPKDATAIVPPKKVIRALYDYTPAADSPNSGYLSFSQGDFLHVVGREDDTDWYEACNPLHNTRGLVPVSYFEPVGKTARDARDTRDVRASAGSVPARSSTQQHHSQPHDSGYQERLHSISSPGSAHSHGHSLSHSIASPSHPQNIMAQQLRMSQSGKTGAMVYGIVMYDFKAERPDELEAKEGEAIIVIAQSNPEWFVAKPITRLGGPGLIPVSFIEIRDMTTGQAVSDTQAAVTAAGVPKVEEWKKMAADYKNGSIPLGKLEQNSQQTLQQGMDRMSLGAKSQNGARSGSVSHSHSHSRNGSVAQPRSNTLAPIKACVPRYCFADDIFWFIIECQMEDGRHWELQRLYQDFYDLQIQLIETFPVEAGTSGSGQRTLPFMPGPVTYVTDNISNGRRANLDEYIKNLLNLGPHITRGDLVKGFFAPRQGDYEMDADVIAAENYRLSQQSGQSSNHSHGTSRQSSADHLQASMPAPAAPANYQSHQRGQSNASQMYPSNLNPPPQPQHQQHTPGHHHSASSATNAGTSSSSALKIKVWFEEDNCVVIRMPASLRYPDLYKKLKERRRLERPDEQDEDLLIEYKDEREQQFYPIECDEDLEVAVERNPKLVLSVTTPR